MGGFPVSDQDGSTIAESSPLQNYCIALQAICDGDLEHVADELLYRDSPEATFAHIPEDQAMTATARVCHIAFYETGLESLVGDRKLFVNVPREWLLKPEMLPPNPGQLVVEVLETVAGDREVVAALKVIRDMGYELALDDFVLTPATKPLLDVVDIIKLDMLQPIDEDAIVLYRKMGLRLLAEKVEDMQTFETLKSRGFELFQGYFYARAETQRLLSSERNNNHAALIQLLSQLQKKNTEFRNIERIIAQDAQLTFLLLRYANSALFHYRGKIQNLFQALQVLGLKQVRNMVVTMLLASNGPASKLLLVRALTRAGMCERLAGSGAESADSAFLAGLLSMMGLLLGRTLEDLMAELALSPEIADAILFRNGRLGELLDEVEAFENAGMKGWPPERIELLNQAWLKSQVWTTEVLASLQPS